MKKDDVKVSVTTNELTIEGERRQEHEDRKDGFYHTERLYGAFCRSIPLPDGTKPDTVHASFRDGVLEIVMDAPAREPRGRAVEIKSETEAAQSKAAV